MAPFNFFTSVLLLSIPFIEGNVVDLTEYNWQNIIEGEWMVEFFAPWCPACKAMGPVWKEFAGWSKELGIQVGEVDVTTNPGLSGRFMVTALPTIFHVKDGVFRHYRGSRDKDSFISFIEEKKWQTLEPVPGWKTPQSFQMSAVSYFFKLSMALRSIHTKLVEEFGIPYWGSYILFALATIILGAILGLIVVCVIDLIFPPRQTETSPPPTDKKTDLPDSENEEDNVLDDSGETAELRKRKVEAK